MTSPDPARRTANALADLETAMTELSAHLQALVARSATLRGEVESGMPLAEAIAREPRPLIITQLAAITDRLGDVGGEVRRAEAHQLRGEGFTQEQIADAFGVSRQRAAALLKPPSARS